MKTRRSWLVLHVIALAACCLIPFSAAAQDQPAEGESWEDRPVAFGAGLTMKAPYGDYGNDYKTGYGIMGFVEYPFIPLIDLTAGIGWNHFSAEGPLEALDIWEFVGGARLRLGVFFMSGEVGYYTNIEETSFLPGMGLRFTHFELALNIRAVSGGSWRGLRLGYYF